MRPLVRNYPVIFVPGSARCSSALCLYLKCSYFDLECKRNQDEQAQRRAATETAAFIQVFRYNDDSLYHLENDFEMNPPTTQTWDPHGGIS